MGMGKKKEAFSLLVLCNDSFGLNSVTFRRIRALINIRNNILKIE
jgi:hypothetical protein